jgi:RNA polymerase sigma factor (sigma-70 family)
MGLPSAREAVTRSGPVPALWVRHGNIHPFLNFKVMAAPGPLTEPADEALFARIAGGDLDAFAAFYDRHEAVLFGVALRILRDEREAEDVLQDAAVLIWERAPGYNPTLGKPLSWAVTVVRNKAVDRIRSARRKSDLLEALESEIVLATGSEPTPDSGVVLGETGTLKSGAPWKGCLPNNARQLSWRFLVA